MAHSPTQESDDQKVFRIAKVLGISLEDAALTCAGFELAFSNDSLRREIFGIIDQLDESAAKKGEPMGLIIRYTVELGMDGIRVGRYADEIPPGQVVELTPTNRAMIFLKIKDNFPTQQYLGPLIVNRPNPLYEEQFSAGRDGLTDSEINKLPSLDKEGCPVGRGGLTDCVITEPEIPTELPSHWNDVPICLGPIRHTFNERFPFVSAAASQSQRSGAMPFLSSAGGTAPNPPHHLPPWSALLPASQSTSGLSPPFHAENLGHSKKRKMSLRHWQ